MFVLNFPPECSAAERCFINKVLIIIITRAKKTVNMDV